MYKQYNNTTLEYLQSALDLFHTNKKIFINLSYQEDLLDLPKLHSLQHYIDTIHQVGALGGVSTEEFKHTHIESSKLPWARSNHYKPIPQMIHHVEQKEKVRSHEFYIAHTTWRLEYSVAIKAHKGEINQHKKKKKLAIQKGLIPPKLPEFTPPEHPFTNLVKPLHKWTGSQVQYTKKPSYPKIPLSYLKSPNIYQVKHFVSALKDFIYHHLHLENLGTYSIT